MIPQYADILLLTICVLVLVSATWVVISPNLVHSAVSLLFTLFGVAGLYVFLYADFMAASQVIIYVGGIAAASIPSLLKHKDNHGYNSVGASGAVSAVLFTTIAFMPFTGGIGIMFIPLDIPPLIFGVLYIAYEMYMGKRGGTNIAHDAHIGGAAFGFLFALIFVPNAFTNFLSEVLGVLGF